MRFAYTLGRTVRYAIFLAVGLAAIAAVARLGGPYQVSVSREGVYRVNVFTGEVCFIAAYDFEDGWKSDPASGCVTPD